MSNRDFKRVVSKVAPLALALTAAAGGATPVTTRDLLAEMTDLKHLAEFPSPAYTTKDATSYDRKSTSASDHDAWFANGDADQWIRIEHNDGREERVMMEANGPGAIVRIWSANPAGMLRIYLDGSQQPVIEAKMEDLLSGKVPGLPAPISAIYSKGYNLYLPIPYAKSCKVTSDAKGFYYAVAYRTYEPGTEVATFVADDLKTLSADIDHEARQLATPSKAAGQPHKSDDFNITLAPGETKSLAKLKGASAIDELRIRLGGDRSDTALRGTILRISFDGEQTVEVPLGDFFGTAPGVNVYESLPLGMSAEGEMYSHWTMPFRESASVEVTNLSDQRISFAGSVGTSPHEWTANSMHFNAGYRAQYDVKTRPMFDWNYLTAHGKGVFAGVAFAIDNPNRGWWGEGDEKIYVDRESFPSWFGTGSEDYYGYAWCWPGLFTHAYHAQTRCDGPGNYGRTSVNRFHIFDSIPFQTDFKFDMEIWHWKDCKVNLAVTAYWYAMPGGSDTYASLTPEDVVVRPMEPYKKFQVAGVIEGESMKVLAHTAHADVQEWDGLSNESQLWWHDGTKTGDQLALEFDAPEAGRYQLVGRFLKAPDYGIVQLSVNGKSLGQPIDLFDSAVVPTDELPLGVADLQKGPNRFEATIVGSNPKSKGTLFGVDYLKLEQARAHQ